MIQAVKVLIWIKGVVSALFKNLQWKNCKFQNSEERKRGKALKARNKQQSDCTTGELEKALTGFNSRLF